MQALKCEKKLATGIFTNVLAMIKEEGALRPMRVNIILKLLKS